MGDLPLWLLVPILLLVCFWLPQLWRHSVVKPGPYRGKPEIDIEFLTADGEPVGTVTAPLEVVVSSQGLLVRTTGPVNFINRGPAIHIAAWRVWVGDVVIESRLPNLTYLDTGYSYRINHINFPIKLIGDFDFTNGGHRPNDPTPMTLIKPL